MNALVIAMNWPSDNSGYGIALASALTEYLHYFRNVHLVALTPARFRDAEKWRQASLSWTQIAIPQRPRWQRFLQSLTTETPAIAVEFAAPRVRKQVGEIVQASLAIAGTIVFFEDVTPAVLLPWLKKQFDTAHYVVHSYNVVSKGFEGFTGVGSKLLRAAWSLEVSKMANLERTLLRSADSFWAISEADRCEYEKRYDIRPDDVVGVTIDAAQFSGVKHGDIDSLLYLGSADLRKGNSLDNFITWCWPAIQSENPSASFLLAGANTERFTRSERRIYGMGFCSDAREFLGRGQIFVNPQEYGSGIKLKSIVAMLAGKALVSTEVGIEGIAGEAGRHYLAAQGAQDLNEPILQLMRNTHRARQMAQEAQQLTRESYSAQSLRRNARRAFEALTDALL